MLAKDKAWEIYKLFGIAISDRIDNDGFICNTEQAKKCAIIAVDEIIKSAPFFCFDEDGNFYRSIIDAPKYWEEVKKQIELL
jgi:hypothetical protein